MSEAPTARVAAVRFHVLNMRTRFPFQYGIASMTALPHLFVSADAEIGGRRATGISSDGLPPKWFTKNPGTAFEDDDLPNMLASIQNAAAVAGSLGECPSFFALWQRLYAGQADWAKQAGQPGLLANLGVSLIERALLDAMAKALGHPAHALLRANALGIDLAAIHPELRGMAPADALAPQPLASVIARHTVGLGDPLEARDIAPGDQLDDGLPYALDENIREYGLTHFKVKVCGDRARDFPRLRWLADVLIRETGGEFWVTFDGNEQFASLADFADFWAECRADGRIAPLVERTILVEQPLHRSAALADDVAAGFQGWSYAPPVIIDESDADLSSLPRALELGYSGCSHKNCKGIVKGIANAALLAKRRAKRGMSAKISQRLGNLGIGMAWVHPPLSGEDLANVGPVALLQDLAVAAALGIAHIERNGHHYFRGLSMYPDDLQAAVCSEHPDLYAARGGTAALRIEGGKLDLRSVHAAPFGCGIGFDPARFTPLAEWGGL